MSMRSGRPQLPYKLLAGVEPCPGGWLVASAKLQGITMYPQEPEVYESFTEVLDYKPAFSIIAVHIPIGLLEKPRKGGRTCEREARRVLGWPRSGAIQSAPARPALKAKTYAEAVDLNDGMNVVTWSKLPKIAEVAAEMQPYWQRTVYEVNPELGFYQLNGDSPLQWPKRMLVGHEERRALLEKRVPGVNRILEAQLPRVRMPHLLDAAADLWSSRRIMSRAVNRLPEDPEWDNEGLRMEILR